MKKAAIGYLFQEKNNNIFIFDSFGIGHIPKNIYDIYKNLILLQTYIEFNI